MSLLPLVLVLAWADPPATIELTALDRMVIDSLKDVHNRGAELYNDAKDYTACFRMYEGALRTVRPLLAHRPATQKTIDAGLAKLADDDTARERAFRLHEVIEKVRGELRDAPKPAGPPMPPPVSLKGVPPGPGSPSKPEKP